MVEPRRGEAASLSDEERKPYLRSVERYLHSCFERRRVVQVAAFASELKKARPHVSEVFASVFGQSLTTLFRELQVRHAEQLLRRPQLTIDDVWRRSGFGCQRSFFRVFKRVTGTTPGQFRASLPNVSRRASR